MLPLPDSIFQLELGFQLIDVLREAEINIPVILYSSMDFRTGKGELALNKGAFACVSKGERPNEYIQVIRRALGLSDKLKSVESSKFFAQYIFYSERFAFLDNLIRSVNSIEAKQSFLLLQKAIKQKVLVLVKIEKILSELEESNLQKERKDFWQLRIEDKIFLLRYLELENTLLLIEDINSLESEIEAEIEQEYREKEIQQKEARQENVFFLAVIILIICFLIGSTIWQHKFEQNQLNIPPTVREELQKD
jgi:hypothetical protein